MEFMVEQQMQERSRDRQTFKGVVRKATANLKVMLTGTARASRRVTSAVLVGKD